MTANHPDQSANEIGLNPCPFCSEQNEVWLRRKENNPDRQCTAIQCESCGAIGPVWSASDLNGAEYDAEIIRSWNGMRDQKSAA